MKRSAGAAATIAGVIAALIPPILVLGAGQPAWLALAIAMVVFVALWFVLKPAEPRGRLDADAIVGARRTTARELLEEGEGAIERLRRASRAIGDQLMREELKLLVMKADRVLRDVRHDPDRVMAARRMITFYLPNAASVAEGWRLLESKHQPAPERIRQTRETIASLNDAFTQFADQVHEPQMQALDLDLRVLNDALKRDVEEVRR